MCKAAAVMLLDKKSSALQSPMALFASIPTYLHQAHCEASSASVQECVRKTAATLLGKGQPCSEIPSMGSC